ncbi:hypothetical protein [uncultured Alistipes sp.]|jgi:hypothetical protein|nr:hypothetical protein [uncultured Alistipes sp.]
MERPKKRDYKNPEFSVLDIDVEKGFAASTGDSSSRNMDEETVDDFWQ